MYAKDTIAAIATPPGTGGIGIVRVSGAEAQRVAAKIFVASRVDRPLRAHQLRRGRIVDENGETLDDSLLAFMPAPHSYTGEDVVEFHCHGSPIVLRILLERCLAGGARLAEPGEFTKRAFLNGRIDLVQAEAVAELIEARTEAAARIGARHLSGALSSELAEIRELLVSVKARTEVMIDFSEEEVDMSPQALSEDIETAQARIAALLQSFRTGKLLREGVHVALIGRPNVGKSSLLNALVGHDRAIVTPVPGTTRDVIVETIDIDGIPVVVADTAGIRAAGADDIERLGIERAEREAAHADAVLILLDRSQPLSMDDRTALGGTTAPAIVVANKIDLSAAWSSRGLPELDGRTVIEVSALTHEGLDRLRAAIVEIIGAQSLEPTAPIVTLSRHGEALRRAGEALSFARESLASDAPIDLTAVDIQAAVEHIGSITGDVTSEEVLDRIFRDFCIGK